MSCTNLEWSDDIRYLNSNSYLVPEFGGIYKVLRNDGKENKLSRVYVGKAENLRSRYNRHLSEQEENICLRNNVQEKECYFRYALLAGEDNRKNAEDHLLKSNGYECNAQGQ